jgi:mevalonate kinase
MNNNAQTIQVRVPGSIMLTGEHAVLRGHLSVSAAVDQYINIRLTPRNDEVLHIKTDRLGEWSGSLQNIEPVKPFQFVLSALKRYESQLSQGFDVVIQSEFSSELGLGSSAAVTVAMVLALHEYLHLPLDAEPVFIAARDVVRSVQGLGSGADVAASVCGGVVAYHSEPMQMTCLSALPPLCLIYSGKKVPTATVVKKVNAWVEQNPLLANKIFTGIGECSLQARRALDLKNWALLGEIFSVQQALMCELKLNNEVIDIIVSELNKVPTVFGAKISGAGLGDCVLALGHLPDDYFPMNASQQAQGVKMIKINVSNQAMEVLCDEAC